MKQSNVMYRISMVFIVALIYSIIFFLTIFQGFSVSDQSFMMSISVPVIEVSNIVLLISGSVLVILGNKKFDSEIFKITRTWFWLSVGISLIFLLFGFIF